MAGWGLHRGGELIDVSALFSRRYPGGYPCLICGVYSRRFGGGVGGVDRRLGLDTELLVPNDSLGGHRRGGGGSRLRLAMSPNRMGKPITRGGRSLLLSGGFFGLLGTSAPLLGCPPGVFLDPPYPLLRSGGGYLLVGTPLSAPPNA